MMFNGVRVKDRRKQLMIYAQFFAQFQMAEENVPLSQDQIRSDMVTKLLSYMIYHRGKNTSVQELAEVLWPDDRSDNPAGALKNLMYRLRNILKKTWGDRNFVITGKGSYQWNPELPVGVDAEEFEKLCTEAKEESDPEQKILKEKKAVALYKGRFLPEFSDEYWIMSLSVYYHSLFLSVVKELAALLEAENQFEEMERICRKAIEMDSLDEELHCCLLRAYIGGNKQSLAAEHYRETVELLYDNLGVRPSEDLQEIYDEMMKQLHDQEADLNVIQEELREAKEKRGAFYCEYGVFKKTYELEVRRAGRIGMSIYLSLITLHTEAKLEKGSVEYLSVMSGGMDQMQAVLLNSLRSGDVVTRYSTSQFLVMLPGCQYENARMVLDRINYNFYSIKKHAKVRIQYSLDELNLD